MNSKNIAIHVQMLGWLFILSNAVILVIGLASLLFLPVIGMISGDAVAEKVLGTIGVVGVLFFTIAAVPGLLAGYGLINQRPWARILGLILAIFELVKFPLGTLLGVYAFWVLMQDGADEYFAPLKPIEGAADLAQF